jgi:hypothetical protein
MDASGKFAGALVYSKWKGRPTVRQLVTPSNPNSADQEASRNAMRVAAVAQRFVNLNGADVTPELRDAETETDKALLIAAAPPGQAWNGFLVKSMIGAGQINYTDATAAYAVLAANHAAYDTAADGMDPPFTAVNQTLTGGGVGTPMEKGEALFHYFWGLFVAGLATEPGAVPFVYAL